MMQQMFSSLPLNRRPLARRVLVGFIALLLAAFIVVSSVGAQAPAAGPTPLPPVAQSDPFFGIVQAIHNPDKAVAAGARWERLVVWWSSFQPEGPDDWKPDAWFARNLVEDQKNRGIEPVGVVLHTPEWAAQDGTYNVISPPKNLDLPFDHPDNYWGQFLARLASEYAGLVDHWILWNEPDIYKDSYANWAGTVEEFARMQVVGYQAIKKGNPNAKVILTGTTYWWDLENARTPYLDRLLAQLTSAPGANANGAYFDAVAVHQYSSPLNSYAVPVHSRRILERYGLSKPIWIVESNVVPHDDPLHPLHRGGLRASMEEQASYMIQSVALARAAGVERYAIYKMLDEDPENDQYYGLVRNDGTVRPAYIAYQVAVRELSNVSNARYFWSGSAAPPTGEEVTALLASTNHSPQFVWPGALNGVRMRRGADRVTVLWNATAAPLPVGIPSSVATATVVNKYGERQPITRGADGAFRLTLAPATNNTDARDERLVLVGGDPVILIEPGAANARDAYPRPIDACWGVPGALVPENPTPAEAWVAPTGYAVSGPWLTFLREHGDVDYIGYPRSPVVQDPLDPDQCVQYFQRLVLEWHPENAPPYQIQRRLLASEMLGAEPVPPSAPAGANSIDYWYFAKGTNGLGHPVTNIAPDGTRIGFKSYFDRTGKEDAFGYPMEPPTLRTGPDGVTRWTQRFQAAIFEYHQEFDREGTKPGTGLPWRNWTVQLKLLGDEYLASNPLPFVVGDPAQHRPTLPQPTP
ncbi:MAG: glycoside hydrolase family protein [Chloroflexota bacterium]|nr:glycoside hydrolase family protein [Chloroflexota bacterium]